MTQDQLARRTGVSASAVNKWEKGASYPDITLLPVLARTLGVDMNTLLGFQETLTREEVGAFADLLAETARERGLDTAFQLAREKLREYPANDLLALSTAQVLDGAMFLWADEGCVAWKEEVMELYHRCVGSRDPRLSAQARRALISRYMGIGDLEQAERLLRELPEDDRDRPVLEAQLLRRQERGEAAWSLLERRLLQGATDVYSALSLLMELALDLGETDTAAALADTACKAGEVLHLWPYLIAGMPFQLAVAEKNGPAALAALERMLRSLTVPWALQDSPLYRHIPRKEGAGETWTMMLRPLLESLERDPACAFLRTLPEYQRLRAVYLMKEQP